ncbi:DUF4279 domain-containing protein [Sphingorhabdus lacus]|uniref:DUF4279 domain-containing protein n=1 Tax=Sphingorhabdus lacus TaxID=392610 RepID=A0A6I6L905_9SPHN|nr:DUF4279 domain-containing protein [Sphingorhabdus lacus]QGY81294.1 DUF4279 domain-containing protein [Sphingorhabdus lacus]
MENIHQTAITLRFRGDDLDPEELTSLLGAIPTNAATKGAPLQSTGGRERVAKTGHWHLRVDPAEPGEEFDEQLIRLFKQLTPDLDAWRYLSERYVGNLFVGFFLGTSNMGVEISSETLSAISARGLELGLNIYSHSDE